MLKKSCLLLFLSGMLVSPAFLLAQGHDVLVNRGSNESKLEQHVRHRLLMLPYYTVFDHLGFRVQGSTVTLLGSVTNPVLKSDAENAVKSIEGVTQVNNDIEVLPISPMDAQIRRAEFRAIYDNPQIGDKYGNRALLPIHIIVKNGHVTLEGVVANQFDKNFIGIRASSVPNVFSLTNNLQVESGNGNDQNSK